MGWGEGSIVPDSYYSYNLSHTDNLGPGHMRVSTADFIKNYGALADRALAEPVTITKNGRDRLVVISAAEYSRLKQRDRRVIRAEDVTDAELAMIETAEVPAEYGHLKDWRP